MIAEEPAKRKRKKVSRACINCRKAHVSCDDERPCKRCHKRSLCCEDAPDDKFFDSNSQVSQLDFFQMFANNSLQMDEPNEIFQDLNRSPANIPNCFSQLDINSTPISAQFNNNLMDIEELFPSNPYFHVCKSRGLPGCDDCSLNVENILPQPLFDGKIGYEPLDFHSKRHLPGLLQKLQISDPLKSYVLSTIDEIFRNTSRYQLANNLQDHIRVDLFPATPSCIVSPTGSIRHANNRFASVFEIPQHTIQGSCFYKLLDFNGLVSFLEFLKKGQCHDNGNFVNPGFLRLTLKSKSFGTSISFVAENGKMLLALQFIP
jgi:Fungal Zn(2)-Cys(6) binuclear cluster domain